jgi:hypothetical protein
MYDLESNFLADLMVNVWLLGFLFSHVKTESVLFDNDKR